MAEKKMDGWKKKMDGWKKKWMAEMEKGLSKAMKHSMYQAYLANSGLDNTSPQPSGPWGKQIKFMVGEFGPALKAMGLLK